MLTTERQQFEEWLKFHSDEEECTNLLQRNSAGTNYLHPHADLAWIAWQASRELLANREAQPVEYGDAYQGAREDLSIWKRRALEAEDKMRHLEKINDHLVKEAQGEHRMGEPILTAPPAPAVPDGYCVMPLTLTAENGAKCALAGEFKVSRTVRCHECDGEGCDDCADAGEFEEEITVPWDTIKDIYRAAVDACRAAMLAQPVSGGYTLPDGWVACSERMPASGGDKQTYVLAGDFKNHYWPNLPNTQVGVYGDWFNDGNPTWDDGDGNDLHLKEVTHWMPLPVAPEVSRDDA